MRNFSNNLRSEFHVEETPWLLDCYLNNGSSIWALDTGHCGGPRCQIVKPIQRVYTQCPKYMYWDLAWIDIQLPQRLSHSCVRGNSASFSLYALVVTIWQGQIWATVCMSCGVQSTWPRIAPYSSPSSRYIHINANLASRESHTSIAARKLLPVQR